MTGTTRSPHLGERIRTRTRPNPDQHERNNPNSHDRQKWQQLQRSEHQRGKQIPQSGKLRTSSGALITRTANANPTFRFRCNDNGRNLYVPQITTSACATHQQSKLLSFS
ncbi:hypothetical protein Mp_5g05220 [Marchantia polymorpha subsp. ruderalis]|uniref:Uncharacterized protein n=2 Tax=Marchantia polymorpha TaxID=3197 RepID=A0AAF6BF55_MARPO|nr:hypothetical protein MARPO_0027s0104 [Marchantia polymorpha]BBN10639.1 hypothetical protein Mp_5g05220 [Marchantia polymorpha subsp. ruderalis]|eukprot:PTQ42995.1 hypothetical protein MARPO_0027s0104 [Marchantia polymorpha]